MEKESSVIINEDSESYGKLTFESTNPDVDVTQILETKVVINNKLTIEKEKLLNLISSHATEITCSDFKGKGSIDDYKELFIAASNIVESSKNVKLDVDITGLNDFGNTCDELSDIFTSYITKLEKISIIDDLEFLRNVEYNLSKIVKLSNVFSKFKSTIIATSTINIPSTTIETSKKLNKVMDEINCAMNYISHFVEADPHNTDSSFHMGEEDKKTIEKSVGVINSWSQISEYGVKVSMTNNEDIQKINLVSDSLKQNSEKLKGLTSKLKNKLSNFGIKPKLNISITNSSNVTINT